jgi:hypothetical protein
VCGDIGAGKVLNKPKELAQTKVRLMRLIDHTKMDSRRLEALKEQILTKS